MMYISYQGLPLTDSTAFAQEWNIGAAGDAEGNSTDESSTVILDVKVTLNF